MTNNTSFNNFLENCTVVLAAGGESSRFKNVPGAAGIQKAAFRLPNGETMIERTIKIYRDAGLKNFVILAFHQANSLEELLGDGNTLGVNITYSYDPEKPVGRGGAMKHALANGSILPDKYLIVHNPDDQIVSDPVSVVHNAISTHLAMSEQGALATAIMVEGTFYDYSGFKVSEGKVMGAELYPFISMPTHIGMTIFSPEVSEYFDRLFDVKEKCDFEALLFPVLTEEGKLSAHFMPTEAWISVNDEKGLKKLLKAIE